MIKSFSRMMAIYTTLAAGSAYASAWLVCFGGNSTIETFDDASGKLVSVVRVPGIFCTGNDTVRQIEFRTNTAVEPTNPEDARLRTAFKNLKVRDFKEIPMTSRKAIPKATQKPLRLKESDVPQSIRIKILDDMRRGCRPPNSIINGRCVDAANGRN